MMDRKQQRRVWNRVLSTPPRPRPQPQNALRQAIARCQANGELFAGRVSDPVYGPAYAQLRELNDRQLAMLRAILRGTQ